MKAHPTKALWLSVGVSLGLHALLFVVWLNDKENSVSTQTVAHTINIQLVDATQSQQNKQTAKKETASEIHRQNAGHKQLEQTRKSIPQKKSTNASKMQTQLSSTHIEQDLSILYKLLYKAINQKKHYPVVALRMQQQGTVRVAFKLFNNGNMNGIAISESSGYNSLDKAALQAVKRIQPFQPAAEHIASVKDFQVDIIFQL